MEELSWVRLFNWLYNPTEIMKCHFFLTAAATVSGLGNLVPVLGMGGLAAAAGEVRSLREGLILLQVEPPSWE